MLHYRKICGLCASFLVLLCLVCSSPIRAVICHSGAAPCVCLQQNKFVQYAQANHGAPVHAVSWCCQPVTNAAGHPSIHLATAGDPVLGILPGEINPSTIMIRIYELDLVTEIFAEMNSYLINDHIQGAGGLAPEIYALDWCCTDNQFFLVAGGNNLAYYPDPLVGPDIADVAVFTFENVSWQVPVTTRIPFTFGKAGYYYYTYGNTVYAVAALCKPCTDSTILFYLAIGGATSTIPARKQISIVNFVLEVA